MTIKKGQGRLWFSFLIAGAIFLFSSEITLAASIDISGGPSQLTSPDEEYAVNVALSINTADGTNYYLRGVFYKPGSTNYCGYTWSGQSWFSGPYSTNEGWKNFLKITTQSSSWSGQLKAKINTEDTGCQDSGTYNFKVQRFTEGGSSAFDSQSEQTLEVSIPTPTPTPTSVPTSTPTPTPDPTAAPTSAPAPTATPTSLPKKTATPTPKKLVKKATPTPKFILGQEEEPTPTATEEVEEGEVKGETRRGKFLPLFLLFLGLGLLAVAAYWLWYNFANGKLSFDFLKKKSAKSPINNEENNSLN